MITRTPAHDPAETAPAVRPRIGLGPLGITIRVVVAIASLVLANVVVAALGALVGATGLGQDESWLTVALFVLVQASSTATAVLAVWMWVRLVERRTLRSTLWRWQARGIPALLLGIVIAGATSVAATAALPATGPVADAPADMPIAMMIVVTLSQIFLLQAVPEELLFRGSLLTAMRSRPVLAIAVTTLSFTAIHLVSNGGQQSALEHVLYLVQPFGFALLAAGLLLWTGSLWAAIGVHGGFHVGAAVSAIALPQVDAALSWVVIGGVHAVVGLALVVTALRTGRGIPA